MSLIGRLLGSAVPEPPVGRDPLDDFWYTPASRVSAAGIAVDVRSALRVPVVYDCLTVLSQTIAALPWAVFERGRGGDKTRADGHPLVALLRRPSDEVTSHEFFAQLVWDLASAGNFFAVIVDPGGGFGRSLRRLEPSKVRVERLEDGSRRWEVTDEAGRRRYVEGEVWHVRVPPLVDGLVGTGRVDVGREAIGALLAVQEYGARYFRNDATPPVVIKHPAHFRDAASRENFLRAIGEWFGLKRNKPAVLEYGMEIQRLGATNEESQFLETRKELQNEVARLWRMPPHKVGIMDRATFSNIEEQALEFVTDTLGPWLDLVEKSVNHWLMRDRDAGRYFFEFNVDGLLRGNIEARYAAFATARQWGWLSVNEIRKLENLNPIGRRGDQYLQPLNMVPAGDTGDPNGPPAGADRRAVLGPRGEVMSRLVAGEWRDGHVA